jgi:hypothetical protein
VVFLIPDDPSKMALIWINISTKYEDTVTSFLKVNIDIFAWKPSYMLGVSRELAEHFLALPTRGDPPSPQKTTS